MFDSWIEQYEIRIEILFFQYILKKDSEIICEGKQKEREIIQYVVREECRIAWSHSSKPG